MHVLQDGPEAALLLSHGQQPEAAGSSSSGRAPEQAPLLGPPQKLRLLAGLSCLLLLHWQGGAFSSSSGGGSVLLRHTGSPWGQAAGVSRRLGGLEDSSGSSRRLLWEQWEGMQQHMDLGSLWRGGKLPQWARCDGRTPCGCMHVVQVPSGRRAGVVILPAVWRMRT
jgi:hypothetical protein